MPLEPGLKIISNFLPLETTPKWMALFHMYKSISKYMPRRAVTGLFSCCHTDIIKFLSQVS
jgi:hypothetical protein